MVTLTDMKKSNSGMAAHLAMAAFSVLCLAALAVTGCKEQGPVELIDGGKDGPIEVLAPPPQPMPGMELGDADSAGIVPLPPQKVAGHIMIAGARYDGPLSTIEATLSRAILFDLSSPVSVGGDRMAYNTLDAGAVDIDGLPLLKVAKRVRAFSMDTVLGVQYVRYNQRPDGFRYAGGTRYTWTATGGPGISPFTADIVAPPNLFVETLDPAVPVSALQDLRVGWRGGGPTVQLVISVAGDPRVDSRPILHLRLGKNRGGVVIPARILRLLPANRDRFVFTFFSDVARTAAVGGLPEGVIVQALTSHSILVRMTR